jgi:hypothetical protein
MVLENILKGNEEIILIGKSLLLVVIGILIGFIIKKAVNKIFSLFLKKIFSSDIRSYETSKKIISILSEILQWIIFIVFINYSLVLLEFNLLSNIFSVILTKIPQIIIFIIIISAGIVLSKMISTIISKKKIGKKEEISSIVEIIIIVGFVLTALEYVGVKATALLELYKAIIYVIAIMVAILIIRPEIFYKSKEKLDKN